MPSIRPAAVAGQFYPAEPAALRAELARCFADARPAQAGAAPPKLLVVPHAGTVYSGAVAASAYALLAALPEARRAAIRRVVLLGPVHRVPVRGLAAPTATAFDTPLGRLPVDLAALATLAGLPQMEFNDRAHAFEHALEVQLPFLIQVLGLGFALVPLAVGEASPAEVDEVLERLWGGDETLVVISSDLSHYLGSAEARARDADTVAHLLALDASLQPDQACGAHPLNGALRAAARHGLRPRLLDLRNSGDTAGDRRRVVGYAALAFESTGLAEAGASDDDALAPARSQALGRAVVAQARNAIATALGLAAGPSPEHPALAQPGASFVTLHDRDGALRGCIGRLEPTRALRDDLRANARAAAFDDPRFPPLAAREWPGLRIEVSLLGPLSPIAAAGEAAALAALRPGVDGVVLSWQQHRGTFLPQVWQELPAPAAFLAALKRKAGLPAGFWAPDLRLQRFEVRHFEGPA